MSSSFENKLTICEIDPMWEDFGKIDFSISLYQQMGYEIEFEIDPAWENFGKLPEWKQAPAWEVDKEWKSRFEKWKARDEKWAERFEKWKQAPAWEVDEKWKARFEKWKAQDEKWAERCKELKSRELENKVWNARFHEVLKERKEYFESEEFKSMRNKAKRYIVEHDL